MTTRSKSHVATLAALIALSSGTAMADYGHDFRDRAKVVSSTPVYEQINEPRRECWNEYESRETYRSSGNNTGGAILGAVVGGLVGSTVGKGNGKVAAAAVGAATGAVVGDRWNDRGSYAYEERPVERCRVTDNYRKEIVGYDVVYRYSGRNYSTRLPHDPGEWLDLNVSFSVSEPARGDRWNESRSRW